MDEVKKSNGYNPSAKINVSRKAWRNIGITVVVLILCGGIGYSVYAMAALTQKVDTVSQAVSDTSKELGSSSSSGNTDLQSQVSNLNWTTSNLRGEIYRMQGQLSVYDKSYQVDNSQELAALCGADSALSDTSNTGTNKHNAYEDCVDGYPNLK
jgi:TolA-binding protein